MPMGSTTMLQLLISSFHRPARNFIIKFRVHVKHKSDTACTHTLVTLDTRRGYYIYYICLFNAFEDKLDKKRKPLLLPVPVEDMIKEVDVDGDGRIDFYGKLNPLHTFLISREIYI